VQIVPDSFGKVIVLAAVGAVKLRVVLFEPLVPRIIDVPKYPVLN
jgi:hypothetical protein